MWTPLSEPFRPDTDLERAMGFLVRMCLLGLLPKGEHILPEFD